MRHLAVVLACLLIASACTTEPLPRINASTASGEDDLCQLLTDQRSRNCLQFQIDMANHYCDMISEFGKEYGRARSEGIVRDSDNKSESDRRLALESFDVADTMNCRGLGSAPPTTTTRRPAPTTRTTIRRTTTTTLSSAARQYLSDLWKIKARAQSLAEGLQQTNEDWDARTATLSDTDAALEEATRIADSIAASFNQIRVPSQSGMPAMHNILNTHVEQIRTHTHDMLAGLRSPDAGEARTQALIAVIETADALEDEIDRAEDFLARAPARTTTTRRVTTTRATKTTTVLTNDQAFQIGLDLVVDADDLSFADAKEAALGVCAALTAGYTLDDALEGIAILAISADLSDHEIDMLGAIIGLGVGIYCPEHGWQYDQ